MNTSGDLLTWFRNELRIHHQQLVEDYFNKLLSESAVDVEENRVLCSEIDDLGAEESARLSKRRTIQFARAALILTAGTFLLLIFVSTDALQIISVFGLIASLFLIFAKMNSRISDLNSDLQQLGAQLSDLKEQAWQQMAPLNDLFNTDCIFKIIQTVVPQFTFDRFTPSYRMFDIDRRYGLHLASPRTRSIEEVRSGTFAKNPFAIFRLKEHWMGSRTYSGSIVIYWSEQQRDSDGKYFTVQRSQTLTASITKPFPVYHRRTVVAYGHDAAPDLTFSRQPSRLSGKDSSAFIDWRKERVFKGVERKSRRAVRKGTGDLTPMSNKDFETLFKAIDRDDEQQFRLIFTPLAQEEMVNLLNDRSIGFGDDFSFFKDGKINLAEPRHLRDFQLNLGPPDFYSYSVDSAKQRFVSSQVAHFRHIFFALAPFLTIPSYRETGSVAESPSRRDEMPSVWAHETLVNSMGQQYFAHELSETETILNTSLVSQEDGVSEIAVDSYGFSATERIEIVLMRGADGALHEVPVTWIEYTPVTARSSVLIGNTRSSSFVSDERTDSLLVERLASHEVFRDLDSDAVFHFSGLVAALI